MSVYRSIFFLLLLSTAQLSGQSLEALRAEKEALEREEKKARLALQSLNKDIDNWEVQLAQVSTLLQLQQKLSKGFKKIIATNNAIKDLLAHRMDSVEQVRDNRKDALAERAQAFYVSRRLDASSSWISWSPGKRVKDNIYLKQYKKNIQQSIESLDSLTAMIVADQQEIDSIVSQNRLKLDASTITEAQIKTQKKKLSSQKKELLKEKKKIEARVKKQQQNLKKINTAIVKAIERETKKEKRKVDVVLNKAFEDNKGKLPLPLDKAIVLQGYGEQQHAVLKQVKIMNNGLDLSSTSTELVQAVFDGRVISIQEIPGAGTVIIIHHGAYYTVYSKLDEALTAMGAEVKTGETIGRLPIEEGAAILHFELWKGQQKQNPEDWLLL